VNRKLTRRATLHGVASLTMLIAVGAQASKPENDIASLKTMLFRDPNAPTGRNAQGNLTIVDFFDYNCPFCKASAPHLERLLRTDGNIRVICRDWPILAETSEIGAQMALAAKYQEKYQAVHDALLPIPGNRVALDSMRTAILGADVDMDRLDEDMKTHADEIGGLIARNLTLADAIGLRGTPGFLVGKYMVNQALTCDGFVRAAADARAARRKLQAHNSLTCGMDQRLGKSCSADRTITLTLTQCHRSAC
jgi:protein-disulfide isomerase